MHNASQQGLLALVAGTILLLCVAHAQVSGSWTPAGTIPWTTNGPTSTLLPDGTVLVAGGTGASTPADDRASAAVYDPGTNSWTPTASMLHPRVSHAATLLCNTSQGACGDDRVLVVGGIDSGHGRVVRPNGPDLDSHGQSQHGPLWPHSFAIAEWDGPGRGWLL